MALIINTNISALTAQRNLTRAQGGLERSIQRLSTGLRINGAVDDAAGLAISDRLSAQIQLESGGSQRQRRRVRPADCRRFFERSVEPLAARS